ncbi:class D beta-lactamase [Pseudothauera nasutitermitis]|uniref:Beta-lactamase n=1 Tax=Pseudothauera nasutitermitis TaxID=2565930 RepID=A0A4S4B2V7_9RHOO|nr:class D beta-lactamase [Pseudothauera nasutitermitis]THF66980.1 class D beta-lactamase [Pseudothauera nasutitermitis]
MKLPYWPALLCAALFSASVLAQETVRERADWARHFDAFDARGTMVVEDARGEVPATLVFDARRAAQRYSPASTFKIPHTLFALDAGVLRDEFQVFAWDGAVGGIPAHNRDQRLRSAMAASVVWVYRQLAGAIGEDGARRYLAALDYGNGASADVAGDYWLDGKLAISAHEQVAFLKRLYRNELPFRVAHQRLVKDVTIVEAGRDWILRAKTGWDGRIGWWVGWVERPEGPVFFALNIDTPERVADLPKREAIARAVLRSLEALPE